ncbi:MAG TPA: aldehyde dehydrogenase (NADP(+)) [Acidobacteriaceae bacterium]|nr:aldehyde dehydrogenase (NADP(+)) [Acidobacteriaceae bacterium]
MELAGLSLIAGVQMKKGGAQFRATNPATGQAIEPTYCSALAEDVDRAARAAQKAFVEWRHVSGVQRAHVLHSIAEGLDAATDALVARAQLESALPEARLRGETLRTSNQLRMFAQLIEEGSWVEARIHTAMPERTPLPRPDLRSMLQPLGPVAVFGASNFPLAYSVAGGDTASALAAGNAVVVKAHPAHPGTSELAGRIITESIRSCGAPEGLFSLLFDAGLEVGKALVQHPLIQAVGFTGSRKGGRALMDLAAQRPRPIPCFAEMGSTNPVFVLPGALRKQGMGIATGLFGSFTAVAGQQCTKPGMVFLPDQPEAEPLMTELRRLTAESTAATLLTPGIAASYRKSLDARRGARGIEMRETAVAQTSCGVTAALLETEIEEFLQQPELSEEVFGPTTLVIRYGEREKMMQAAEDLEGHLTATVHGTEKDLAEFRDLIAILERKAGRVIFNGYPTGVEVSDAMVHGGPYPATSDSRFTSVGTPAVLRFARPVCYQGCPEAILPEELRDANPRGILRAVNGKQTREAIARAN